MSSHDKTFCVCYHVIFLFGTISKLKTTHKPETKNATLFRVVFFYFPVNQVKQSKPLRLISCPFFVNLFMLIILSIIKIKKNRFQNDFF